MIYNTKQLLGNLFANWATGDEELSEVRPAKQIPVTNSALYSAAPLSGYNE